MAKKSAIEEAQTTATEATAAVAGAAAKVKGADPMHSAQGRFCIKQLDDEGKEIGEPSFTDNPHVAYAARGDRTKVIDHKNGNREYDGTDPSAREEVIER